MARYTGPAFKKSRRLGFSTLETGKEFAKGKQRQYAPGQHGQGRVRLSEYALHLHEKQKLRTIYGINERQFKKTFVNASKMSGVTGVNFLKMLETRLDSLVYRMGLVQTRRQARQLVNHNHILLNDRKADIPSIQVKIGERITLKPKSHKNKQIIAAMAQKQIAPWLEMDKTKFAAKLARLPERNELNNEINESLVVEYYNK